MFQCLESCHENIKHFCCCKNARLSGQITLLSINPILSETTLEFMLGQDEIFVRAKIQREFEYFDELNIIHNERSEF